MKRRQLIRHLKKKGCELRREGSRHSIYWNPKNRKETAIPRHVEVENLLAMEICKQLGIEPIQ